MDNPRVWRHLDRPEFGMVNTISEIIRAEEWKIPDLLTTLRMGPTLGVVSDYGGEHQESLYRSLSFLLFDLQFLWYWQELRAEIRARIIKDSRRLAFKSITEKIRSRALVPFLRAANALPGLLATFLIDKRIATLFQKEAEDAAILPIHTWKPGSLEKLLRIGHMGSLMISGMIAANQNILWISDEDEIAANITKHREATRYFAHCLGYYLKQNYGHFRLGTAKSDNGSMEVEDLLAIPDLAAGALAEVASITRKEGGFDKKGIVTRASSKMSLKANAILAWHSERHHPLRRLTLLIEHVPPNEFKSHLLTGYLDQPIPEYDWVPEFIYRTKHGARRT
jgi:hypothetical protein